MERNSNTTSENDSTLMWILNATNILKYKEPNTADPVLKNLKQHIINTLKPWFLYLPLPYYQPTYQYSLNPFFIPADLEGKKTCLWCRIFVRPWFPCPWMLTVIITKWCVPTMAYTLYSLLECLHFWSFQPKFGWSVLF